MVKVSGGARTRGGVEAHLAYIGRDGELGVEVDHGFQLVGKGFEKKLVPDWDLDLLVHRRQDARSIRGNRRRPKLVHNIIFSMPPGTSGKRVLGAVRMFALNEFALKHRYALVLRVLRSSEYDAERFVHGLTCRKCIGDFRVESNNIELRRGYFIDGPCTVQFLGTVMDGIENS